MGRPIHADVTSLRATSRSGGADDNYLEIDDGSAVPVGFAGRGKLRYVSATPGFEGSYEGGAWTPIGGGGTGWERWTYLPAGSTYAEIQAALNDAAYEGVFLAPGNYGITDNLVIPDGKILSAAVFDTNPSLGGNVILTLTANKQIQVQRGTFQFCRVDIDVVSNVNHVTCAGGKVLFTYVTCVASANNTMAAFYGTFAELGWCSTYRVRGVFTMGSLPDYIGKFMDIHSCQFVRGNTSGNVVYINDGYVKLRDIYTNGGDQGFHLSGALDKYYLDVENIVATGTVGTYGIMVAAYHYASFRNLISYTNATAISISACSDCHFDGMFSFGSSATGIFLSGNYRCDFAGMIVYNGTGTYGIRILGSGTDNTYTNSIVSGHNNAAPYAMYVTAEQNSIFNGIVVQQIRGGANAYGLYFSSNTLCVVTGVVAYNCQGIGIFVSTATQCTFTSLSAAECDSAIAQIMFESTTHLQVSQVFVHNSAFGVGIHITTCTRAKFSTLQSRLSGTIGVNVVTCTDSTFDNIQAQEATTYGISLGTPATPGSVNNRCSFSNLKSSSCTSAGITTHYLNECQVAIVNSYSNGGNGITSTNNTNTQFSTTRANNNTGHGVEAGTNDSYCTWSDNHLQNNGAGRTNFLAQAATAMCYCNGSFEQLGIAAANDTFPVANWTSAGVLAIP